MAYEVTATRRRPQAFDALAGQEFVAETLRNTISSGKIAHAYLFSGPRGCGKTSTARILAKALNCAKGPTPTPCGECEQCREITRGASADVIEIDGASNTSVEDIRQIKEEVLFAPQGSRYKIYIIDEVHMLSVSAFNALLKTIEEPPEYVVFVFATTELQKVPATIKSRCQQFNFRLVPIETVEKLLAAAAEEIGVKADEEALFWVARESTGSVRDAYTLFDQVAAFSGDHITYDKIRDKLGLVGVDSLNVIFEDCAAGRAADAILKLDGFLQGGISIEQFIVNSADYFRSLLLIKNGITRESLLGQSAERFSQAVLTAWRPVQIERAISLLLQLHRDIRYSLSPRYELELAVSRLAWLSEYVSPAEVKKAIEQAKSLLLSSPTTMSASVQRQGVAAASAAAGNAAGAVGSGNAAAANASGNSAQAQLAHLMNPTAWQRSAQPSAFQQRPQPAPTAPPQQKPPLPVFDALKNLPEYRNAPPVSAASKQNFAPNAGAIPSTQNFAPNAGAIPPTRDFAPNAGAIPQTQNFSPNAGAIPPTRDFAANAGAMPPTRDFAASAGAIPPTRDFAPNAGAIPPTHDFAPNAGAMPPTQNFAPNVGAIPPTQGFAPNAGAIPPTRDFAPNDGAIPPTHDFAPNAGAMPPTQNFAPNAGAIPQTRDFSPNAGAMPPTRDFAQNDGANPPTRDFAPNAGTIPPTQNFAANAGAIPPTRDFAPNAGAIPPTQNFAANAGANPPTRDFAPNAGANPLTRDFAPNAGAIPQTQGFAPDAAWGGAGREPRSPSGRGSGGGGEEVHRGGGPLPVADADLRRFATDWLSTRNAVLAAKLMQTACWRQSGGSISLEVSHDFALADLEKNRREILAAFSEMFGRPVDFSVVLKKREVVDVRATAPEPVRLICDTFRGEIVGVGERSAQAAPAQAADGNDSAEDADDQFQPGLYVEPEDDD